MPIRGCQIGNTGPQPFPPLQILKTWQKQAKKVSYNRFPPLQIRPRTRTHSEMTPTNNLMEKTLRKQKHFNFRPSSDYAHMCPTIL